MWKRSFEMRGKVFFSLSLSAFCRENEAFLWQGFVCHRKGCGDAILEWERWWDQLNDKKLQVKIIQLRNRKKNIKIDIQSKIVFSLFPFLLSSFLLSFQETCDAKAKSNDQRKANHTETTNSQDNDETWRYLRGEMWCLSAWRTKLHSIDIWLWDFYCQTMKNKKNCNSHCRQKEVRDCKWYREREKERERLEDSRSFTLLLPFRLLFLYCRFLFSSNFPSLFFLCMIIIASFLKTLDSWSTEVSFFGRCKSNPSHLVCCFVFSLSCCFRADFLLVVSSLASSSSCSSVFLLLCSLTNLPYEEPSPGKRAFKSSSVLPLLFAFPFDQNCFECLSCLECLLEFASPAAAFKAILLLTILSGQPPVHFVYSRVFSTSYALPWLERNFNQNPSCSFFSESGVKVFFESVAVRLQAKCSFFSFEWSSRVLMRVWKKNHVQSSWQLKGILLHW